VVQVSPRAEGGGELEAVLDRDQVTALADWLNRWLTAHRHDPKDG
jgi:hypothetical protein